MMGLNEKFPKCVWLKVAAFCNDDKSDKLHTMKMEIQWKNNLNGG